MEVNCCNVFSIAFDNHFTSYLNSALQVMTGLFEPHECINHETGLTNSVQEHSFHAIAKRLIMFKS